MTPTTITLTQLNAADVDGFVALMDGVWEHAPWVARAAAAHRPFDSVDALHRQMLAIVGQLPEAELLALLAGHPDLAGAAARAGTMTRDSSLEQGALSLDAVGDDELARWDELNAAYRRRFGFPFILCVKRHTRSSVLATFERRLGSDRSTELRAAVEEIGRITRLRLAARIADHGLDDIAGRLTTHVLDTSRGRPAAGMRLSLHERSGSNGHTRSTLLAEAVTDGHGSTPQALLDGAPLRIGRYEMQFHVGDYFRSQGVVDGEWPFLDVVPIVFCIDEPEGDYHVPLTVTPWAYGTYRGQ